MRAVDQADVTRRGAGRLSGLADDEWQAAPLAPLLTSEGLEISIRDVPDGVDLVMPEWAAAYLPVSPPPWHVPCERRGWWAMPPGFLAPP